MHRWERSLGSLRDGMIERGGKKQTTTITKLPRVSSETPKIPGPNINPAPNKKESHAHTL